MSEVTLDFIALLRRLVADVPSRGATLNAALQQLASQELRDLEPDASLLEALLSVPTTAWDSFSADDLYKWHTLLTGVLQIPEVVSAAPAAAAYATDALIDGAFARAALPPAEETAQAMTPGSSLPGCVSMARLKTKVDVRDLESIVRTGDLILFSSKHAAAQVTKCFTASTWDHCGMVVKFSSRHVFILEYAGGVFLYPLFTRLYTYYAIQGREIVLRRLLPGQDRVEMQRRVESFVRGVLGQKPPSIEEILLAVLKQEGVVSSFLARLAGTNEKEHVDNLETLFCSKLIACVYKEVGILGKHRKSSDFLPKHFAEEYDEYLDLQAGALLGPGLPINFMSVAEEVENIRQRIVEEERKKPEAIVRAVSQFYVAARSGVGGLGDEISRSFRNLERGLHGWSEAALIAYDCL
ncbi:ph domain-containing protein [Chrysochromulina tobinii]|uniref:Ph domain-containing protein n=1 Tax=Chrysochromulina tobinii TaxID=1460289 RepID=A0A0M0KAK5_9EUKA|nr:ph domain-containing protein [Chrysochromulina tobinii]|eukprot:KOO35829.1 ph domain-containing protein [Chrysochromulina sp. CCMP291]